MDFKKFGNFNWIEMNSKVQNLNLTQTKRTHFCPFQFIFVCWDTNAGRIKIANTYSSTFNIKIEARQGCIFSPHLFNIYSEYIMRSVMNDWNRDVVVSGRKITNLRYADDTIIFFRMN